jgi:hypothetical protein
MGVALLVGPSVHPLDVVHTDHLVDVPGSLAPRDGHQGAVLDLEVVDDPVTP